MADSTESKPQQQQQQPASEPQEQQQQPASKPEEQSAPAKHEEQKKTTDEAPKDNNAATAKKDADKPAAEDKQKKEEPSPKKQQDPPPPPPQQQRRKSASPDPDAPPPTYLRGTQASQHRASPSRPADKAPPPTVTNLAKMSAMERVKKEHSLKLANMKQQMEKGVACFGASSPRGITPEQHVSPQQQRARAEQRRRHLGRFKSSASLDASDAAPVAPSTARKEQPSWFTKSKISGDRHQFQRIWPGRGFPHAAVQKVFTPAAPGPGAYADSVSFVKPCPS